MASRKKMSKKASRKNFKKGTKTHVKNLGKGGGVMRGGYRL